MERKKIRIIVDPNYEGSITEGLSKALKFVMDNIIEKAKEASKVPECETREAVSKVILCDCLDKIADRCNLSIVDIHKLADLLAKINPSLLFSLFLKEIAVNLDSKYEDHISKCEEIFTISTLDGRIHRVPRANIKNFRNFAAFRTEEDARTACRILRPLLKSMFKNDK